jgi:Family of unknown function (DUF5908)
MPIEIKELHIKINVNEGPKPTSVNEQKTKDGDAVAECVEEVMKIIERKKER